MQIDLYPKSIDNSLLSIALAISTFLNIVSLKAEPSPRLVAEPDSASVTFARPVAISDRILGASGMPFSSRDTCKISCQNGLYIAADKPF